MPPEEILILFRDWSEQADLVVEILRAWGMNVHADEPGSLRAEPSVSALRAAARLPLQEWEIEQVVRLLRNGQLCPEWPDCDHQALATAASVIQSTSVFRGVDQLLQELDRAAHDEIPSRNSNQRHSRELIMRGRELVKQLFDLLIPIEQSRTWSRQVAQLRNVARGLGLEKPGATALDTLWDFLDDHALVLDRLGLADRLLSWRNFLEEVEAIVAEIPVPAASSPWASIQVTTVNRAAGVQADHIILADLVEGSFPERASIEPFLALRAGDAPGLHCRTTYGKEMCRFLRVHGVRGEQPDPGLPHDQQQRTGTSPSGLPGSCSRPVDTGSRRSLPHSVFPDSSGAPGTL